MGGVECLLGAMLPSNSTLFSGASDECVIPCVAVSLHYGKRLKQNTLHASEATFEINVLRGYRCREEAGEVRVGDVDFTDLYLEVSKAIWHGTDDGPKTTPGFRSV